MGRQELHLVDALAASMSVAVENLLLIREMHRSSFVQTVTALAQTVELRDPYTGGHAQRVTDYSLMLAEELKMSSAECHDLRTGAPLHDIGKIGIDDAILRKHGPLTPEECREIRTHPAKGEAILQGIPALAGVLPIVRSHHERWDGAGYPDGLAGPQIPLLARVVAVADTFDAMTTTRPYREGLEPARALAEIEKAAGSQFDPACVAAFARLGPRLEERVHEQTLIPTSTSVRLRNEVAVLEEPGACVPPSRMVAVVRV
jgi:HD-GYP domain-containing protein (c-di-GMP phosphodiesterase class II)